MKRIHLIIAMAACAALSCTKTKTTTNTTTTILSPTQPAFVINGINDITFTNNFNTTAILNITVQYLDSAQESVHLAVTGLPAGIEMDTMWVNNGIPTFSTHIGLYDTINAGGAAPGTYPLTLTATTTSGKKKTYPFNLRVLPMPTAFLGKYNTCYSYCGGTGTYSDSVYADPGIVNKIWFTNFGGTGDLVYALIGNSGGQLIVPSQTVNGHTYSATGDIFTTHRINISMSTSCALNMF
jgi:hypothetical protein